MDNDPQNIDQHHSLNQSRAFMNASNNHGQYEQINQYYSAPSHAFANNINRYASNPRNPTTTQPKYNGSKSSTLSSSSHHNQYNQHNQRNHSNNTSKKPQPPPNHKPVAKMYRSVTYDPQSLPQYHSNCRKTKARKSPPSNDRKIVKWEYKLKSYLSDWTKTKMVRIFSDPNYCLRPLNNTGSYSDESRRDAFYRWRDEGISLYPVRKIAYIILY